MIRCAIALGGNVGDVAATFDAALQALDRHSSIKVVSRSKNYSTSPIGVDAGGAFINAVAIVETSLSPWELLDAIQKIEGEAGRTRGIHWGPRPLDIDLISYGSETVSLSNRSEPITCVEASAVQHRPLASQAGTLMIPHPACWYRRFVLDPWWEIQPDWVHPVLGESVREMLARVKTKPLQIHIEASSAGQLSYFHEELRSRFTCDELQFSEERSFTIRFNDEQAGEAFCGSRGDMDRVVVVPENTGGISMAEMTIRAALDQPFPLVG